MVGIDVGATKITRNNGMSLALLGDVPHDLLKRVAEGRPHIQISEGVHDLRPAHTLYAEAVGKTLEDQLVGCEDEPIALAVPAWWSPRSASRVREALAEHNLNVITVNDAEAAVAQFQHEAQPLPKNIAVVSLRAEQTSVAIVQNGASRPRALLSPALVNEEGGSHLDTAVLRHLCHGLVDIGSSIDTANPRTITAATLSISQCQQLRESLTLSANESVRLHIPGVTRSVRLVRSELEELARPWVDTVVRLVASAIELCHVPVEGILLTGGVATMPLVSQRLSADLGLEVFVPKEPQLLVARGADRLRATQKPARRKWNAFKFPRARQKRKTSEISLGSQHVASLGQGFQEADDFFALAFAPANVPSTRDSEVSFDSQPVGNEVQA